MFSSHSEGRWGPEVLWQPSQAVAACWLPEWAWSGLSHDTLTCPVCPRESQCLLHQPLSHRLVSSWVLDFQFWGQSHCLIYSQHQPLLLVIHLFIYLTNLMLSTHKAQSLF